MRGSSRRIVVIALGVITVLLVVVAIVVATRLQTQPTTAPEDTSAAGGSRICGQTCNTNSDCAGATAPEVTVECIEGTCQSRQCYDQGGNTVAGTICSCDFLNPCGSKCGADVGLCGAGSMCAYIAGPTCAIGNTYCIPWPLPGDNTAPKCVARDQYNNYLLGGDGKSTWTQAEVQALCNQDDCGNGVIDTGEQCDDGNKSGGDGCSSVCQLEEICGDGIVVGNEECDEGAKNGQTGSRCSSICTEYAPQCDDGIDNDNDGFIDCAVGAPDPGCFPNGAGGGGSCNPEDNNETDNVLPACSDGVDNDGDGLADCDDPGCYPDGLGNGTCDPNDDSEVNATPSTPTPLPLPQTALVSDEVDAVLVGMLLLVGGIVVLRYRGLDRFTAFTLGRVEEFGNFISETERTKRKVKKTRNSYEDRF